jgi:hypothetical protein
VFTRCFPSFSAAPPCHSCYSRKLKIRVVALYFYLFSVRSRAPYSSFTSLVDLDSGIQHKVNTIALRLLLCLLSLFAPVCLLAVRFLLSLGSTEILRLSSLVFKHRCSVLSERDETKRNRGMSMRCGMNRVRNSLANLLDVSLGVLGLLHLLAILPFSAFLREYPTIRGTHDGPRRSQVLIMLFIRPASSCLLIICLSFLRIRGARLGLIALRPLIVSVGSVMRRFSLKALLVSRSTLAAYLYTLHSPEAHCRKVESVSVLRYATDMSRHTYYSLTSLTPSNKQSCVQMPIHAGAVCYFMA